MTKGKNFSNSLASAVGTLTKGMITDPVTSDPETPIELKPEKKEFVKIVLRMDKEIHTALRKEARTIAAEEDRNYSLTELINDILTDHLRSDR